MVLWPQSFVNSNKNNISAVPDQGVHSKYQMDLRYEIKPPTNCRWWKSWGSLKRASKHMPHTGLT